MGFNLSTGKHGFASETAFPEVTEFCSFTSPKGRLRHLESCLKESMPRHLPSITSFKDYAQEQGRKASIRDKEAGWGGGDEGNKMDYEFENCQLSCIIQLRALAQCSATIQIFQLKWLYIQASKLTIK